MMKQFLYILLFCITIPALFVSASENNIELSSLSTSIKNPDSSQLANDNRERALDKLCEMIKETPNSKEAWQLLIDTIQNPDNSSTANKARIRALTSFGRAIEDKPELKINKGLFTALNFALQYPDDPKSTPNDRPIRNDGAIALESIMRAQPANEDAWKLLIDTIQNPDNSSTANKARTRVAGRFYAVIIGAKGKLPISDDFINSLIFAIKNSTHSEDAKKGGNAAAYTLAVVLNKNTELEMTDEIKSALKFLLKNPDDSESWKQASREVSESLVRALRANPELEMTDEMWTALKISLDGLSAAIAAEALHKVIKAQPQLEISNQTLSSLYHGIHSLTLGGEPDVALDALASIIQTHPDNRLAAELLIYFITAPIDPSYTSREIVNHLKERPLKAIERFHVIIKDDPKAPIREKLFSSLISSIGSSDTSDSANEKRVGATNALYMLLPETVITEELFSAMNFAITNPSTSNSANAARHNTRRALQKTLHLQPENKEASQLLKNADNVSMRSALNNPKDPNLAVFISNKTVDAFAKRIINDPENIIAWKMLIKMLQNSGFEGGENDTKNFAAKVLAKVIKDRPELEVSNELFSALSLAILEPGMSDIRGENSRDSAIEALVPILKNQPELEFNDDRIVTVVAAHLPENFYKTDRAKTESKALKKLRDANKRMNNGGFLGGCKNLLKKVLGSI